MAGSDEGYHSLSTATHNDGRSVFSSDMSLRFPDPDHRLDGLSYESLHVSVEEHVADYSVQQQPKKNSLRCERERCNHESRTQSEYRYVSPDTQQGSVLTDVSGDMKLVTTKNTSVRCLAVHERRALQLFTIS